MDSQRERLKILNVWIDPVDMEQAIAKVKYYLNGGGNGPRIIYAVNPEKNYSVPKTPELHRAFEEADLLIPDGIGVVLAARILYGAKLSRVPGADLNAAIWSLAVQKGYRIFVYGAKEEVNRKAVETIRLRHPGIKIVGRANGYLEKEKMSELIADINRSRAEILFVALGSPKQEIWISTYKDTLRHVRVCQGIGGTLDTIAGTVKRAPKIWQRFSAEWLYRLLSDPRRFKRQKMLFIFAAQVFLLRFRTRLSYPA